VPDDIKPSIAPKKLGRPPQIVDTGRHVVTPLAKALGNLAEMEPQYRGTAMWLARADYSRMGGLQDYRIAKHHLRRAMEAVGHVEPYRKQIEALLRDLDSYWNTILKTTEKVVPQEVDNLLREVLAIIQPHVPPDVLERVTRTLLPEDQHDSV